MKKILRLVFFICCAVPVSLQAQLTWPLGINGFILPRCDRMPPTTPTSCTKTAVTTTSNPGFFDDAATWNPSGVPGMNDIVCIPEGFHVKVKSGNRPYPALIIPCGTTFTNTSNNPRLAIFICGTLEFENSGKLNLGCGSVIQIFATTGTIIAAQGNSDVISIGEKPVWGQNNSTLTGPTTITYGGIGQGVLSVSLKSFEAKLNTPFESIIRWTTSSEFNSKEFIVEKSTDAVNWNAIQTISAKGNSNSESYYSLVDKQLSSGTNYYRLKQVDTDGKSVYSETVAVLNKTKNRIAVYPNPAIANATLYTSDVIGRNQIVQLYNMNGAFIQNLNPTTSNVLHFSTMHLSPGLYLIRITENGKTIAETKLIKQ